MSAFATLSVNLYTRVLPLDNARTFVDLIFGNYDKDENGSIDFSEFIVAMNASMASSVEEKLRMAFCLFDRDKSGTISVKEMVEVIGTLYSVEGHKQVGVNVMICSAASPSEQFYSFAVLTPQSEASERAEMLFGQLDRDLDGEITQEEFIRGCLADDGLLGLLNNM